MEGPQRVCRECAEGATAAQKRRAASGLPSCMALANAELAFPVSKEKTSATGIPLKYLFKRLTALSPKDSLYACTFEGCDQIFKQLASVYSLLQTVLNIEGTGGVKVHRIFC